MREIFIEEAREVVGRRPAALGDLAGAPDDLGELTTVRRAFHTLKGSSRMVGLKDFGEAAWACEQLYNTRLAEGAGVGRDLLRLSAPRRCATWATGSRPSPPAATAAWTPPCSAARPTRCA